MATIPPALGAHGFRRSFFYPGRVFGMSLAFHPTECGQFKVVCVRDLGQEAEQEMVQVQVYSSDTRKLKILVDSFRKNGYVFGNGAIHWPPSRGNHLWFNIEAEQLQALPLPVEVETLPFEKGNFETYFGESRGHLHFIQAKSFFENEFTLQVNVYEMLRDRSGWFVRYRVELDDVLRAYPPTMLCGYIFSIIDVIRGEKEEDTFMVLKINNKNILTFNVLDKSFKNIHDFTGHEYLSSFHRYTEALTSF
ncbi:F-box protein At5g07610-like [Bidens hawaiensis]|uniref:F-box protein At5g07610-like n=1 Tax=Bidens hawaiensis TaxID=980011 RepID=UPI00404AFECA